MEKKSTVPDATRRRSDVGFGLLGLFTAIGFGVASLLTSLLLGGVFVNDPTSDDAIYRYVTMISFFGLISLPILILLTRSFRKGRPFWRLFRAGLWIGMAIYALLFVYGAVSFANYNFAANGSASSGECTTLQNQLAIMEQAVVPIATDKGYGTAFAVGDNNTLLTAYHVIEGGERVYANYVSGEVPIEIIKTAPELDLALLRIDTPTGSHLNLTNRYALADELFLLGYPGNALTAGQASLSKGILSRIIDNETLKLNAQGELVPDGLEMIQTDATVNLGNSGGPLVSKCGVIGVISSKSDSNQLGDYIGVASEQGINFAISSKTASRAFELGISGAPIDY